MLERLTRPRLSGWIATLGLSAVLVILFVAGPRVASSLRYERAAVLHGQWWRLVGGHLVHADAAHLAWNIAGLLLVGWLFAREYSLRGWLLVLTASTAAIDLGFLAFEPQLEWYVGFSGVLHGCMAAGLVAWLRTSRDSLTAIVAVAFAAKLGWEHFAGALPFTAATLSLPVVHQAHTYGALGGLAAALYLNLRQRLRAPSL
jgi:rhomboid family GlyGly-CTERM serine protease